MTVLRWRLVRCGVFALLWCHEAVGQTKVTTVAGGYVGDGRTAISAAVQDPQYTAIDSAGNVYVTDYLGHRIRKVSITGIISTVAGTGIAGFSGEGGVATSAKINLPAGIAVDANSNVIFSDGGNNRIRKISTSGIITTIAGTGAAGFSGDGGSATNAKMNQPYGLSLDSAGNLFFADRKNKRIRKIDTAGNIHTVAGNGKAAFSGDGGLATLASLNNPDSVSADNSGNLYIADTLNHRVRKVDATGKITTLAGGGTNGCTTVGPATSMQLGRVTDIKINAGNLLISNAGCDFIREVNLTTNVISTVAGSMTSLGFGGFNGNGHSALSSVFLVPTGILYDKSGNLLIVDSFNDQVRKVDTNTQIVTALVGGYTGDGKSGTAATLNAPQDIVFDAVGNMYIADMFANRIRKLSLNGTISTYAGTGVTGNTGDGGPARSARLSAPAAVTIDSHGNLFIADEGGITLRKVDSAGTITTFVPQNSNFFFLTSMIADSFGNIYAADAGACVVWKVTPAGAISAVAGVPSVCAFNSDGIPATSAWLSSPYGVAFDESGNLYIGDGGNNRVRKVDTSGIVSTVAGNGNCGFGGDGGPAPSAMLCNVSGVALDPTGNLYIADTGNLRVRMVNSAGIISTLAGTGKAGYNGNGLLATKTHLDLPLAVRLSPSGVVYVDDGIQYRVRKIQ